MGTIEISVSQDTEDVIDNITGKEYSNIISSEEKKAKKGHQKCLVMKIFWRTYYTCVM